MQDKNKKIDYKSAGVDVERGYEAVSRMKEHIKRTQTAGVLSSIGGFGGMFELPKGYKEPVLVSGTDGVGTKLRLAFLADKHKEIGIDSVAMCVNDVICLGAKPLFFLDYIACGKIEPEKIAQIVSGVSDGCVEAGCALIGGETAEMPGFYKDNEYDIAGFCVGIVEKDKRITGESILPGDVLIGLRSSGLHSNGFSLAQKLCFEVAKKLPTDIFKNNKTFLDELLTPTKIYVKTILSLIDKVEVKGISHITGGGWYENIPRMLPKNLKASVKKINSPEIFSFLQKWGKLDDKDMYSTFNMGIGMVVAVSKENLRKAVDLLKLENADAIVIGTVEGRKDGEEGLVFA